MLLDHLLDDLETRIMYAAACLPLHSEFTAPRQFEEVGAWCGELADDLQMSVRAGCTHRY